MARISLSKVMMRVDPSHWRQVTREELWVTSKLWNTYHAPEHVPLALKRTLEDLGACVGPMVTRRSFGLGCDGLWK